MTLYLVPILTRDLDLPAVVVVVVVATGVSVVSVPPLLQDGRVMSAAPVTAYK